MTATFRLTPRAVSENSGLCCDPALDWGGALLSACCHVGLLWPPSETPVCFTAHTGWDQGSSAASEPAGRASGHWGFTGPHAGWVSTLPPSWWPPRGFPLSGCDEAIGAPPHGEHSGNITPEQWLLHSVCFGAQFHTRRGGRWRGRRQAWVGALAFCPRAGLGCGGWHPCGNLVCLPPVQSKPPGWPARNPQVFVNFFHKDKTFIFCLSFHNRHTLQGNLPQNITYF